MRTATIYSNRTGAYYAGIPAEDAPAMADEWNEGLGRDEWRVSYDPAD